MSAYEPGTRAEARWNDGAKDVPCVVVLCGGMPTRHYLAGALCAKHAPRLVVEPEGTDLASIRAEHGMVGSAPAETAIDDRVIASGKRRSSANRYRAAQDATS